MLAPNSPAFRTAFCLYLNFVFITGAQVRNVNFQGGQGVLMQQSWSEWTSWSACSRTCGGGVRTRTRICKARFVDHKSILTKTCFGDTLEYELCKKQRCPHHSEDFLSFQCSRYNDHLVAGRQIKKWLPHANFQSPCELQCLSHDKTLLYSFGKAIDGTKCRQDKILSGICVNGRCTNIDCAGQLGSDNRMDKCGICRGDNSTCVHYKNTYWTRARATMARKHSKSDPIYDYERIVEIPIGASHVSIRENSRNNFLALMERSGKFLVNGNWRVESPGRFMNDDLADLTYKRTASGRESIFLLGPTKKTLLVLVFGRGDVPTVNYNYWISRLANSSNVKHFKSMYTFEQHIANHGGNSTNLYSLYRPSTGDNNISKIRGFRSYYDMNKLREKKTIFNPKKEEYELTNFKRKHKYKTLRQNTDLQYATNSPKAHIWLNGATNQTEEAKRNAPSTDNNRRSARRYPNKNDEKPSEVVYTDDRPKKKKREKNKKKGSCPPCTRVRNMKKPFCSSDFVLRSAVLAVEVQNGETRYEIEVIQSFLNKVPILSREYVWTTGPCSCPRLKPGFEYLLMGRLSSKKRESRLTLDKDSFARRYSTQRAISAQKLSSRSKVICTL